MGASQARTRPKINKRSKVGSAALARGVKYHVRARTRNWPFNPSHVRVARARNRVRHFRLKAQVEALDHRSSVRVVGDSARILWRTHLLGDVLRLQGGGSAGPHAGDARAVRGAGRSRRHDARDCDCAAEMIPTSDLGGFRMAKE